LCFFFICLIVSFTVVGLILWAVHGDDLRTEHRANAIAAIISPVLTLMLLLGILGLIIYILKTIVAGTIEENSRKRMALPPEKQPPAFPVIQAAAASSIPTDGPGRYRVDGVDRATKMDATLHVEAQSAANARVKAELEGIIVTLVTKI
jgi:hypothetical protein